MYRFIKSKVDFGSEYHEIIERVEIDGEILEVESTIDDHKYIKCSLDKFHKYIKDEYFTGEIGFIDSNIEEDVKKNKHIFKRIRRILEKINDSNSDMNKIIKQSKEIVRKIQKIAKTYNKFALWLSIPQIPTIFVEDK